MKKLSYVLVACLVGACNKSIPTSIRETHVSIIHDMTDLLALTPEVIPTLALYNMAENKQQAAEFRYVLLTDKQYNPLQSFEILNGPASERYNKEDNVKFRDYVIRSFYDSVRTIIATFPKQYRTAPSLSESRCFETIAAELDYLNHCEGRRIIVIYSDLIQNTSDINLYCAEGRDLLFSNPEGVKAVLLKIHPLPKRLDGIEVVFAFQPITSDTDVLYSKLVAIYTSILTERGATVKTVTSNKSLGNGTF